MRDSLLCLINILIHCKYRNIVFCKILSSYGGFKLISLITHKAPACRGFFFCSPQGGGGQDPSPGRGEGLGARGSRFICRFVHFVSDAPPQKNFLIILPGNKSADGVFFGVGFGAAVNYVPVVDLGSCKALELFDVAEKVLFDCS